MNKASPLLDGSFYHGSRHANLKELDIEFSDVRNPFGPAIYLTTDESVASCYSKRCGGIYRVRLVGEMELTINLDLVVEEQHPKAIDAIRRLSKIHYKKPNVLLISARDAIHPDQERRAMANSFLRNRGIWMLYGHLSAYEDSGCMDKGIQYAVLKNNNAHIIDKLSQSTR